MSLACPKKIAKTDLLSVLKFVLLASLLIFNAHHQMTLNLPKIEIPGPGPPWPGAPCWGFALAFGLALGLALALGLGLALALGLALGRRWQGDIKRNSRLKQ